MESKAPVQLPITPPAKTQSLYRQNKKIRPASGVSSLLDKSSGVELAAGFLFFGGVPSRDWESSQSLLDFNTLFLE